MKRKDVELLLSDPMLPLVDLPAGEQADLSWFVRLTSAVFKSKGYTVAPDSFRELTFPEQEWFDLESDRDPDLVRLYKNFAWRGFLKYFQPIIRNNILKGFAYRGNTPLSDELTGQMLRFPSIDWVNATLLQGNLLMSNQLRDLILTHRTNWSRGVYREFKKAQSRLYALLYLMDHLPFVVRRYSSELRNEIFLHTRSSELLRALVPDRAEALIAELMTDVEFSTPKTGLIKCVKLVGTGDAESPVVEYTPEIVTFDVNEFGIQFLPYFQFAAYVDGFCTRIEDTPNKAAMLTLDLQKSGEVTRYATINSQVYRRVYADTDTLTVSNNSKFKCGIDVADLSFKYWNLQASLLSPRAWSGFSPFSLMGVQTFALDTLSKDVQLVNYAEVRETFKRAISDASDAQLPRYASICDIDPARPALRWLLLNHSDTAHPSELVKLIRAYPSMFNNIKAG